MARFGFIHDKLDVKLMVLYIMARIAAPIDFATLTDFSMCDSGVDYFQFAEAISELVGSGHLTLSEECYSITDKGRRDSEAGEDSLSPVVRRRCDQRLGPLNQTLRRRAQVRAQVLPQSDGACVQLTMDDEGGTLFSLTLLAPSPEDGERIAGRFLSHPDRVYNGILGVLLTNDNGSEAH